MSQGYRCSSDKCRTVRRTIIPLLYLPKHWGSFQKESAVTHSSWILFDHMLFFSRAPCEHNADKIQSCVTKASVKDLIEMKACLESSVAWAFGNLGMIFCMHWHITHTACCTNVASLNWRHRTVTQPRWTHLSESAFSIQQISLRHYNKHQHKHGLLIGSLLWSEKMPGVVCALHCSNAGGKNPGKRSPEISSFDSLQLVEIFNSKGLFTRRLALNS